MVPSFSPPLPPLLAKCVFRAFLFLAHHLVLGAHGQAITYTRRDEVEHHLREVEGAAEDAWLHLVGEAHSKQDQGTTADRAEVVWAEKYPNAPPLMLLTGSAGVAPFPTFCAMVKK